MVAGIPIGGSSRKCPGLGATDAASPSTGKIEEAQHPCLFVGRRGRQLCDHLANVRLDLMIAPITGSCGSSPTGSYTKFLGGAESSTVDSIAITAVRTLAGGGCYASRSGFVRWTGG